MRIFFYWAASFLAFLVISCSPKISKDKVSETIQENKNIAVEKPKERSEIDPGVAFENSILNTPLPLDQSIRMGVLKNGMKYFIKKNAKPENRVELRLAVNAGSIDEDDDQKGLAHFIEHMQFNGTEHFKKNELVNYLERVGTKFGADLNAFTSFDKTVYRLQVRSDIPNQLDTGLLVIYDWAGHATMDPTEIDKERGVVIAEWRSRLSPQQRISEQTLPVVYKDSKYKDRLPIGDPDIIRNASYETIKRFYNMWYRPDLMAVVVVGDIDEDSMEKQIREMFSPIKNPENKKEPANYKIPYHNESIIKIVTDKEAPSTSVQIINKLPKQQIKTKSDLLEDVKKDLFNMMINARLDELRTTANPPFIRGFSGYSSDLGDIDVYRSSASVAEGKILEGLKALLVENERVLRFGYTQSELERQKTNMIRNAEKQMKEIDKTESAVYCSRAVNYFLDNDPMMSSDQIYNFLNLHKSKINIGSINDYAKQWIKADNRVILLTAPEKVEVKIPKEEEVKEIFNSISSIPIEKYVDKTIDKPLFSKSLTTKRIVDEQSFEKYGIKKMTLENGIEVYYKKTDFKNDEILFSSYSKGGTSLYNDNEYINANVASGVVSEMGISEFDNIQLKKLLTGKSVSVHFGIGSLEQYSSGRSSVQDLETMFQLINLGFTEPRKDNTAFTSYINRSKGMYANLLKNPDNYFSDTLTKIKYNNNPRVGGIPKTEDFDKLNLDEIYRIYKERFANAGNFKFFFVGNFEESKLKDLCAKYLGNLPTENQNENWIDRNTELIKGKVEKNIYMGAAPKAYIDITYHGDFVWNPDNSYTIRSLIDVLRIKLRETMREDMGGVYGVRVGGGGYNEPKEKYSLNISFNCDPQRAEDLIKAANTVITKLKNEGPDSDVLLKIKESQKQERVKALQENDYWLDMIESIIQDKLDFSELTIESLGNKINKLSGDDIKNAAKKYFNESEKIQVVMYPETFKK